MKTWRLSLILVAVCLPLLSGSVVEAKEDITARLTGQLPLDAPQGTPVTVAWTLFARDAHGHQRLFDADRVALGVFVRLLGTSGVPPTTGYATGRAHADGRYEAQVTVPSGGMHGVQIGLH